MGCKAITKENVKSGTYSSQTAILGMDDCLIYRITVINTGDSRLNNVAVSDMYPAYTIPWASSSVLPMTDSVETVQVYDPLQQTIQTPVYISVFPASE